MDHINLALHHAHEHIHHCQISVTNWGGGGGGWGWGTCDTHPTLVTTEVCSVICCFLYWGEPLT